MHKRFLCDVDEVLCSFQLPALDLIEQLLGRKHLPEEMNGWDVFQVCTKEETQLIFDEVAKPGFCTNLKPYPHAIDAVNEIRKQRHVVAVTSPMPNRNWVYERTEWLKEHFGFKSADIVFTSSKYLVTGDELLDDHPDHVQAWSKAHPNGKAMLWHIHNTRNMGLDEHRVRTWEEVLNRL